MYGLFPKESDLLGLHIDKQTQPRREHGWKKALCTRSDYKSSEEVLLPLSWMQCEFTGVLSNMEGVSTEPHASSLPHSMWASPERTEYVQQA